MRKNLTSNQKAERRELDVVSLKRHADRNLFSSDDCYEKRYVTETLVSMMRSECLAHELVTIGHDLGATKILAYEIDLSGDGIGVYEGAKSIAFKVSFDDHQAGANPSVWFDRVFISEYMSGKYIEEAEKRRVSESLSGTVMEAMEDRLCNIEGEWEGATESVLDVLGKEFMIFEKDLNGSLELAKRAIMPENYKRLLEAADRQEKMSEQLSEAQTNQRSASAIARPVKARRAGL